MNRLLLPLLVALLTLPSFASAKEPLRSLVGVVVKVSDGDTITVNSEGTKIKVRLYGIDAPETEKRNKKTGRVSKPGQPYGEEAHRALLEKVNMQRVRLEVVDIDRYRRAVSLVWLGNRNINGEMVTEGWAWAYRQYLDRPHASQLIGAEDQARQARRGIWKEHNPLPPWEFRRLNRLRGETRK